MQTLTKYTVLLAAVCMFRRICPYAHYALEFLNGCDAAYHEFLEVILRARGCLKHNVRNKRKIIPRLWFTCPVSFCSYVPASQSIDIRAPTEIRIPLYAEYCRP